MYSSYEEAAKKGPTKPVPKGFFVVEDLSKTVKKNDWYWYLGNHLKDPRWHVVPGHDVGKQIKDVIHRLVCVIRRK